MIDLVDSAQAAVWQPMTFPTFRGKLLLSGGDAGVVALGAWEGGEPAGLALAEMDGQGKAEVLSLFVERCRRGRGWSGRLLERLEVELRARGVCRARLVFNSGSASAPAMHRLLARRGWSEPQPRMLLAQVGREIMSAPWFGRRPLPAEFEVFPWTSLSPGERAALESSQAAEGWIPEMLWPFRYEEGLEPCNSLGLRRRGAVVGWVITNRVAPQIIRYSALFVHPHFRGPGRPFALLAEAVRRQAECLGLDSIGSFGVLLDGEFAPMARFVHGKLAPFLRSLSETRHSQKELGESGAGNQEG